MVANPNLSQNRWMVNNRRRLGFGNGRRDFSLASTTEIDTESVEMIPDADEQLTQSELRWCIFESARLDGEIEELNARLVWEVENYNVRSRAYQEQCSKKKFSEADKSAIEEELTPAKSLSLRKQGAARVTEARVERENRRVHVKEHVARVLAAPGHAAEELGRVSQWGDLVATGREQGPWHEVEWPPPRRDRRRVPDGFWAVSWARVLGPTSLRLLRAARRRSRDSQRCLEEGH